MGMKLLSPPQGKSRRDIENASQELRSSELDTLIKDKRKLLNDLDTEYLASLSSRGAKNYEEEQLWNEKIRKLTEEVENLEARKKRALVPLEEREKSVQDKESALLKREEAVAIKESENEYTRERLTDKLDSVSEREQESVDYSMKLNTREFAIKLKEEDIEKRTKALTAILLESYGDIQKSQQEEAKRKAVLKGRDVSITERERLVDEKEKSYSDRERAIADKYRTLLRAITETNLNQSAQQTTTRNSG